VSRRVVVIGAKICESADMPAYVIYQGDVTDPEQYEKYKQLSGPAIHAAGGRLIVRGGEFEVLEGDGPPSRTVVIEFPDRKAAVAWYHSDQYAAARKLRDGAAEARLYAIDGYDDEY
jgi:uncharacterized protein (DUF1330 family)